MIKYEYSLIRSARRSVSVKIKDDNSLEVRAPLKMPVEKIEKFLLSKSGWIEKNINKNAALNARFAEIIAYKKIFVDGVPVNFSLGKSNEITADEVKAKSVGNLKKLYVDALGASFLQLFYQLCREYNFTCGSVGFKDYKAKWGCCDVRRNITFNYKLLMLPRDLWRYVAVHELCHTEIMNHSEAFYRLVEGVMPDYKTCVKRLKNYSFITRLY